MVSASTYIPAMYAESEIIRIVGWGNSVIVEWDLMGLTLPGCGGSRWSRRVPEQQQGLEGAGIIPVLYSHSASLSHSLPEEVWETAFDVVAVFIQGQPSGAQSYPLAYRQGAWGPWWEARLCLLLLSSSSAAASAWASRFHHLSQEVKLCAVTDKGRCSMA